MTHQALTEATKVRDSINSVQRSLKEVIEILEADKERPDGYSRNLASSDVWHTLGNQQRKVINGLIHAFLESNLSALEVELARI